MFRRDISVFSKDGLCQLSFKACSINSVRATMCVIMSPRPIEGKRQRPNDCTGGKKKCPPGLEKREVGGFRNLTWLYTPYILPGRQHCQV